MQACDRDCKLGKWGKWGQCTKACSGGFQFKRRQIKVAAVGKGKCPKLTSTRRLQRKRCNPQQCPFTGKRVMQCKSRIDLVLLLDGSGSVGNYGWDATVKFADKFVESFHGQDAMVSIMLFSGPRTWSNYYKCNRGEVKKADEEKVCGMKIVSHFTNDTAALKAGIKAMRFPRSSTYTQKALEMANAELMLGRKDATRIVLCMTDGIPISPRRTGMAARKLKKKARLMMGAVRLSRTGLRYMRSWSSRPTRDNVMRISNFAIMKKVSTMNNLIRDMCSSVK